MKKSKIIQSEETTSVACGKYSSEVKKESKCPLFNRPKLSKLNRLEEFCAFLVWNG